MQRNHRSGDEAKRWTERIVLASASTPSDGIRRNHA
jgi:hypothetical protein